MSRRRHESPAPTIAAPDRFRQVLLGAVTALLVARPLVAGEDPGRLRALESTSGQSLNLLWLLVAVAASIWITRSPRRLRFGPVVAMLGVAILLVAISTVAASCYRHPAWLIVSEWLQLPVIFLLVRELAADEEPNANSTGGFLAAMAASAISVAGFGAYQAIAPAAGWPQFDLPLTSTGASITSADFFGLTEPAATGRGVRGTLEQMDTLAALILMTLPIAGGYALFAQGWRAKTAGLLLPVLAAVLVLAVRGYARGDGMAPRQTREAIAADLSLQRPLFGVGPGNFERHAPRFVVSNNPELLREPADSWVSLAATAGVPAALLIAGVVVVVIRLAFRPRNESTPAVAAPAPHWEFYLGGVGGLLLGLALRVYDLPVAESPRTILNSSAAAGGRALVWFLAFALFDGIDWRGPVRRYAIAAGLVAAALFGVFSPALLTPSVAQWFWALAALALAGIAEPVKPELRNFRWLTIPAACGLAGAYFLFVWDPAFQSASHLRDARRAGRLYANKLFEFRSLNQTEQRLHAKDYRQFVENMILKKMESASAADPADIALIVEYAQWERQYWNDFNADANLENRAIEHIQGAHAFDPQGIDTLLAELHLRLTFARRRLKYGPQLPPDVKDSELQAGMAVHFREAEKLIAAIAVRAPALESRLRYRYVQALLNAKNDERQKEAIEKSIGVLELDDAANLPWKLTGAQRAQLRKWANLPPETP